MRPYIGVYPIIQEFIANLSEELFCIDSHQTTVFIETTPLRAFLTNLAETNLYERKPYLVREKYRSLLQLLSNSLEDEGILTGTPPHIEDILAGTASVLDFIDDDNFHTPYPPYPFWRIYSDAEWADLEDILCDFDKTPPLPDEVLRVLAQAPSCRLLMVEGDCGDVRTEDLLVMKSPEVQERNEGPGATGWGPAHAPFARGAPAETAKVLTYVLPPHLEQVYQECWEYEYQEYREYE